MCARTQTLHQGKASGRVKARDINTPEKPHRNYTFFDSVVLPSCFEEDVKGDGDSDVRSNEKLMAMLLTTNPKK